MLKKLYVHNYCCFQNFTLETNQLHSMFLLGKNGSGKTTVLNVLEIFQQIGYGKTSISDLNINKDDFTVGYSHIPIPIPIPIHLEIEVEIENKTYNYKLIFELPSNFELVRVKSESLSVNQEVKLSRSLAEISVGKAAFSLDWHKIGLPMIQIRADMSDKDPIAIFRNWLKSIVLLSPVPFLIQQSSRMSDNVTIERHAGNLIDWIRYLISRTPKVYSEMTNILQSLMPDFKDFELKEVGKTEIELWVEFQKTEENFILSDSFLSEKNEFKIAFYRLSDGEKMFFLAAAVLAARKVFPSMLCFWDEPDNYVSLKEIEYFIALFRKSFEQDCASQLIMASHSERVVKKFSSNNIYVLSRESHQHPTRVAIVDSLTYQEKSIVDAYYYGEIG